MSERMEFVCLALREGAKRSLLCERFGISRRTGYKWIARYLEKGVSGLEDRSRRPKRSPNRTEAGMEAKVLKMREKHPAWGGRKICARLRALGEEKVPSGSTITAILRRHGKLSAESPSAQGPWKRFESERPNELWQMDFKGYFEMEQGRCHPLTVLDDHSRYALGLEACANQRGETVQERLVAIFRRYGVPWRMLMDNGSPWGTGTMGEYSRLEVWLIDQGTSVIHGRPRHPQTQGKEERFHRTLKAEVLAEARMRDLESCQRRFDEWRRVYNLERPHEALGMAPPAARYEPSYRPFVESPRAFEYDTCDLVRKVATGGRVYYKDHPYRVGKGLRGRFVALRPTLRDGEFNVYYRHQLVAVVDVRTPQG